MFPIIHYIMDEMSTTPTIIVIGAGAAGMIAAWRAAASGARVLLLEKNPRPGMKIRISGGGKCNITNGSDIRMMLAQFRKNESRFLRFAFHTFPNTAVLDLLQSQHVETYCREDGKVFPVSHHAEDVVHAFEQLVRSFGVDLRCDSPVRSVRREKNGGFSVTTKEGTIAADRLIIAAGGSSYAKTGTTGDGYRWLRELGHTIIPLRPALAPILLEPTPPAELQGTPVRGGRLLVLSGEKERSSWTGDILFTHIGLSGPAALEVSHDAFLAQEEGNSVRMAVDFLPDHRAEALEERILSEIALSPSRTVLTLTEFFVPQRLAPYVLSSAAIDGGKRLNQLTKKERKSLVSVLKRWIAGTVRSIPLDRGEVTAGGVALNEVEPTTMASKNVPGLFLCGEVLDIAGPVGGYNLQAAYSTGYVAGTNAAR